MIIHQKLLSWENRNITYGLFLSVESQCSRFRQLEMKSVRGIHLHLRLAEHQSRCLEWWYDIPSKVWAPSPLPRWSVSPVPWNDSPKQPQCTSSGDQSGCADDSWKCLHLWWSASTDSRLFPCTVLMWLIITNRRKHSPEASLPVFQPPPSHPAALPTASDISWPHQQSQWLPTQRLPLPPSAIRAIGKITIYRKCRSTCYRYMCEWMALEQSGTGGHCDWAKNEAKRSDLLCES